MVGKESRIEWIDEFKGLVLLLVCLYHVEQSFSNVQMGMEHLNAFRMSAFFFISGFLFSNRRFTTFKSYFVHKTKVLLFPYIVLSLLFMALDPVTYNFDYYPLSPKMVVINTHPEILNVGDYICWNLVKIFWAGKSSVGAGPLWFVFTLYSISILFYGVEKLSTKIGSLFRDYSQWVKRIVIGIFAVGSLVVGWQLNLNHYRLPLGIERDLTTIFFFAYGFLCKPLIQKITIFIGNSWKKRLALLLMGVSFFILYAQYENFYPYFSIMNNTLGKNFSAFMWSSIFGILGLLAVHMNLGAMDAKPISIFRGILRNVSRNALVILAVHWWTLLVLRIVFKEQIDKPVVAYLSIALVLSVTIASIPLFRNKLYKLLGKEKISVKESLSIQ